MEQTNIELNEERNKPNSIHSQWRKASQKYYEKNKEILRAKKLAHYHKKKLEAAKEEALVI
jgi:hypothetical protein